MKYLVCLAFLCVAPIFLTYHPIDDIKDIDKYSVVVVNGKLQGSGTIFKRNKQNYVLTCAHVAGLVNNKCRIQKIFKNNEYIETHRISYKCVVIASSPVEEEGGKDLAVLRFSTIDTNLPGSVFLPGDLKILSKVWHIGNINAEYPDSIFEGKVSNIMGIERLNDERYYIINMESRGGSSGGAIYSEYNGKYYYSGMVTRSDRAGITLCRPAKEIVDWLKEQKVEFDG